MHPARVRGRQAASGADRNVAKQDFRLSVQLDPKPSPLHHPFAGAHRPQHVHHRGSTQDARQQAQQRAQPRDVHDDYRHPGLPRLHHARRHHVHGVPARVP